MTRRTRGTLTIALGIVAIIAGILIPPDPWVLLWGPGILLVVLGYAHATDHRPEKRRPAPRILAAPEPSRIYVHNPERVLGHNPELPALVSIRGTTFAAVAYGPDWIDLAYPDQLPKGTSWTP